METRSDVNIASSSSATLIPTTGRKAIASHQSFPNLNFDYFSPLPSLKVALQKQPMSPKPSSNLSFQMMNPTSSNYHLDVPFRNLTHTCVSLKHSTALNAPQDIGTKRQNPSFCLWDSDLAYMLPVSLAEQSFPANRHCTLGCT